MSLKTKKADRKAGDLFDPKGIKSAMEARELNPSLPFAVLDTKGVLLLANERMQRLLGVKTGALARRTVEAAWPFSNEHSSSVAIFRQLLTASADAQWSVQAHLKTYRLHAFTFAPGQLLVVAEMMRSGDLLQDAPSRQVLFRTLSHEIRTSLMALEGYLKMLEPQDQDQAHICERMGDSVERLKKVIERLKDLKEELK